VSRPRPREAEPVTDRLVVLQLVRVLTALAIPIIPVLVGQPDHDLVALAAGYALVVGVVELARRRVHRFDATLVSSLVLVDGVVLAVAVAATGGYRSPLLFLVFLLVVATTLLVSYRTGLKLATWCALLVLFAHAAADAGVISIPHGVSDRYAAVSAAMFLVFAMAAAAFSSVNERSLRHSRAQLEWLVDLGTDLERAHCVEDGMAALVRHVVGRLGFVRAVVLTRHRDGQDLRDGWFGICDDGTFETLVETRGGGALAELEHLSVTSPLLVHILDDDLLDELLPDARNVVVVPVAADDEHYGIIAAEWGGADEAKIPMLTVRALAQAAMHTASALHNAALLDEVERLATRDSLTGIANRRLFDESLARESARARRLDAPLSLVVIDVDHFKQINDTYGHIVGDNVLRSLAEAIVSTTKSFDVPARYGGDEFVLLLPGCSGRDALGVAERVRAEIARRIDVPATVSAGAATIPDNALDGERLVSAADAALYEAKRDGRDRTSRSTRDGGVTPPMVVRDAGAVA
jgi:diguanylate cyclase (GGDEF)-like protein